MTGHKKYIQISEKMVYFWRPFTSSTYTSMQVVLVPDNDISDWFKVIIEQCMYCVSGF